MSMEMHECCPTTCSVCGVKAWWPGDECPVCGQHDPEAPEVWREFIADFLDEVKHLILDDRNGDYGPPHDEHRKIAARISARECRDVTAAQHALAQVDTKLVREGNKHKRDNLLDAAAYIAIAALCEEIGE